MADAAATAQVPVRFETHPSRYVHLKLHVDGAIARLALDIVEEKPMRPGYTLKQNSYDLGVDIELADAVQRLRFEHPEVRCVVVTSAQPRIFCAGANIYMLGSSTHGFKVNFCKFTNETRLALEAACTESGQHYLAALNGVAAGGGYELALACEDIVLCDDGSSAVSFPETPLLAVLPGTGGLTRLVDKRKVRRDLADVFSTLAEGVRGKRAKEWGLVDEVAPKSKFDEVVAARAKALVDKTPEKKGAGVPLGALDPKRSEEGGAILSNYKFVTLKVDTATRVADLTVRGPDSDAPASADALKKLGDQGWHLRAFRELDDALLDLRFNHPGVGLVCIRTEGDAAKVRAWDDSLAKFASEDWFANETLLFVKRALKRLDLTAKSLFAIAEPTSCFTGTFLELALAGDRTYAKGGDEPAMLGLSKLNFALSNGAALPMSSGLTRLESRFLANPARVTELQKRLSEGQGDVDADKALSLGLVTFAPDEIDWDDEVRLAIEERVSLSPDALTGMEANLRFCGPETLETKIFARLSAWQNWIFQRPNAVGERGALTMYGRPERPEFDWRRT
ncbi:MAG: benzoyl-CoA-dihydrodiol lyase [Polyangiaceae bacterium]|nr:benzoyl-CoA-dihydrodiol lyase [Polyangiaceae bacterium]